MYSRHHCNYFLIIIIIIIFLNYCNYFLITTIIIVFLNYCVYISVGSNCDRYQGMPHPWLCVLFKRGVLCGLGIDKAPNTNTL